MLLQELQRVDGGTASTRFFDKRTVIVGNAGMITVKTRWGTVTGKPVGNTTVFLGLPFAAPPVGPLRWLPPQPVSRMPRHLDATVFAGRCHQPPYPEILGNAPAPGESSEDCLYLNIYTPKPDSTARPVMVWIHGGGYLQGSANDFDGSALAAENDVVVVCINYRLGIFGYLDLSRFGEPYIGSANLGCQDQIAALAWVRDHIGDFGGDPDNITIFGESAGGGSVMALLAAPAAEGLFHKAVALSPGPVNFPPGDQVGAIAAFYDIGADQVLARLRAMDGKALAAMQMQAGLVFSASVDGRVVTLPTCQAVARQGKSGVPLIAGTAKDEGTLLAPFMDYGAALAVMPREIVLSENTDAYIHFIETHWGEPKARLERIIFDMFRANALRVAEAASRAGTNAWIYSFELPTTVENGALGATHGSSGPFNFNAYGAGLEMLCMFHDRDDLAVVALSRVWSATLARFARSGDPNGAGLPEWPRYDAVSRACMIIDWHPHMVSDPDGDAKRWYGFYESETPAGERTRGTP